MTVSSVVIYSINVEDNVGWILPVLIGWVSYGVVVYHSPHSWLVKTLVSGNEHRFSQKFSARARIVHKASTTSSGDTRAMLRNFGAHWPYGEWYVNGEQFVIVELTHHDGNVYRSGMRVSAREFALASEGAEVPVTYQLARGPDGPGAPILVWL